jgi:signal transduction histidine kinase
MWFNGRSSGRRAVTAFAPPVPAGDTESENKHTKNKHAGEKTAKRPPRWWLTNWPVRWKVFAIVLVPIALAGTFGGLRISNSVTHYRDLRLAADRAQLVQPVESFMTAMDNVLTASAGSGDIPSAMRDFDARRSELQQRLSDTDVTPGVRSGITTVVNNGQALRDQVASNSIDVRQRVIEYAPLLLAAEDAVGGSVRVDNDAIRTQAQGLSRAVGARGQALMLSLLVEQGGELPEPQLRTSMITVAGTEPSTLIGMGQVLGEGSPNMVALRQEMVRRMAIMSDPTAALVDNADLLQSLQNTEQIVNRVINDTTASVTKAVNAQASASRSAAIRDSAIVLAALAAVVLLVVLVAHSLVGPLRRLRAGALRVAHEDLPEEIERVKAGGEAPPIKPIPVHTTEETGQVAHAVDELHEQALMMASEQAALQLQIGDMFETLSRRSRTLVDQQLALIDRLERNEEDSDRLDSLFRLDHLAARMRRNGANLLVLSGATMRREQADPMPVAGVINAAASEVEDYRRVTTATVPNSALIGTAAADVIHLLAELIDNALRYSPPNSPVRVSAVHTGNGGLVIEISDGGLGMTEGDLRMANTRLKSGGEVNAYAARHMGLFVVGRLAQQHGLVVRLRSSVAGEPRSGTTAGVYVPAQLITRVTTGLHTGPQEAVISKETEPQLVGSYAPGDGAGEDFQTDPELFSAANRNGAGPTEMPMSMLPRRNPGASGIAGGSRTPLGAAELPAEPEGQESAFDVAGPAAAQGRAPTDTSGYFSSRAQVGGNGAAAPVPEPVEEAQPERVEGVQPGPAHADSDEDNPIYARMVSEWLIDPTTLVEPLQSWESVWDHGWVAAAHAEEAPVQAHTEHGLPVREPGARLVPGSAEPAVDSARNGVHRKPDPNEIASSDALQHGRHEAEPVRDPNAIRASISNHFGGVHAGRSQTREANEGTDTE